jgi:hypothetical protein
LVGEDFIGEVGDEALDESVNGVGIFDHVEGGCFLVRSGRHESTK